MPKDTTLLDSPNSPTLDELKAHFQANDFTTEQSGFDLGHATKAEQRLHEKVKSIFTKSWNKYQKEMGGNGSMLNFSNQYPLQLLQNADADLVAGAVMEILSDADLTERIFATLEPSIMESISAYAKSLDKSPDHLTDEEIETAIAEYANSLSGNAVATLMQTQNVSELLSAVKEFGAHEDFNNAIDNNHDKIDFDRKWEHSRTKIGRMLSLDEQIENEYMNPDAATEVTAIENDVDEDKRYKQLFATFYATLDSVDQQILLMREKGLTQTEIAEQLGYKSHSAVTKRLAKMKEQFDEMMRQMKQ